MLLPLELMWRRVNLARDDADTTFFLHLLYMGEFLIKLVTAGLVAAISDDREAHRYRLVHKLVRADGLGEWAQALDEILTGPPAQHLVDGAGEDRRALTERFRSDTWQFEAVTLLSEALAIFAPHPEPTSARAPLRQWFADFVAFRNGTRGHGATTPELCSKLSPHLSKSMSLIIDHLPILHRPWAYLHRNLSGKYRVMPLGGNASSFDFLKTTSGANSSLSRGFTDGIYLDFGQISKVELVETSVDITDFFVPNGGFKGTTFELLSPISDNRKLGNASPYLAPAGVRPPSETEGRGALDLVGGAFTNLPAGSVDYVQRLLLEDELHRVLADDRHPVVTLVGSGGIGKTSLAISVVRELAVESLFEVIIWLSARDIDLLPEGPKVVTPRVLTHADMADQFIRLMEPKEASEKGFNRLDYFAKALTSSVTGRPSLFVFDNFETVRSPGDLFEWIDTHIRLPNKVLITTRYREFKADYPIEVSGMSEDEAAKLINTTAQRLDILQLLTERYRADLYDEADGHPYIIKMLLGEVAKRKKIDNIERIVAGKNEILDDLFERTYARLQPVAKRVFLTLCSWRSLVPQLALEAVLLRPTNEKMDVGAAIEELVQSSFIERVVAADGTIFFDVALVATVFGRKKLDVSGMRPAIQADVEFLQQIGATSASTLRFGLGPRISRLFQSIASRLSDNRVELDAVLPSLEFICRQYAAAWLLLAELHEESGLVGGIGKAAECLRRFLEQSNEPPEQQKGWSELARLCTIMGDWMGAAQAQIEICKFPNTEFSLVIQQIG